MKYEVMIERVARAIAMTFCLREYGKYDAECDWQCWVDEARAAIEAMPKLMPDGA